MHTLTDDPLAPLRDLALLCRAAYCRPRGGLAKADADVIPDDSPCDATAGTHAMSCGDVAGSDSQSYYPSRALSPSYPCTCIEIWTIHLFISGMLSLVRVNHVVLILSPGSRPHSPHSLTITFFFSLSPSSSFPHLHAFALIYTYFT